MQDLKIALVQANQVWESKKENFTNYESMLNGIDADLILLPEMFQTGFSMNVHELSETWLESESVSWLKKLAREKNAAIYTSLMINENEQFFNRGVFIQPDGETSKYDKRKTFGLANEGDYFSSGSKLCIVEYLGWKFQLQICYDLRFPEIVRNEINSNQQPIYDVILYVANWPEKRNTHWKALLTARAIENQCYVAAVNRVGKDAKELNYSGDSAVIDGLGNWDGAKPSKEEVFRTELKWKELENIRKTLPFLRDR